MNPASESGNESSNQLTIIVGLAFSDADGLAFDQAVRIARRFPRSELHLVHVFDAEPSAARSRDLVDHLRLYVNEKAAAMGGLGGITVGVHLRAGKRVREIVRLATEVSADIVVVGSRRGPHLKQRVFGATAEKLVRAAPCPVLVASPRSEEAAKHEPEIEPPCPDCVRARAASGGKEWWCERHSHVAAAAHVYSYRRELPFASHDSEVIPTGV